MLTIATDTGHELVELDNVFKATNFARFDPPFKEEEQDSSPVAADSVQGWQLDKYKWLSQHCSSHVASVFYVIIRWKFLQSL